MRITVVALLLAGLPISAPSYAAAPLCQGEQATIVATWQVTGTDGDDVIVLTATDSSSSASGGGGDDLICVTGSMPADSFGGGPHVDGGAGEDSVEVRLGDGDDYLEISSTEEVDLRFGGGFDELRVGRPTGTGTIDGGSGGAVLKTYADRIDLDLEDHVLRYDGGSGDYEIKGFTRIFATGKRLSLTGDAKDNGFRATSCKLTMRGGKGDDVLEAYRNGPACDPSDVRLLGQKGDDRLAGTSGADVLLGGPGRDKANGGKGDDRCVAEKETACER